MSLLSRDFLNQLGIHLDDETYATLAEHFESTLDKRVIEEIVNELTPEQADAFAGLEGSDDVALFEWLNENVASLSEIVSDEVDILLGEIAEGAEKL